MEDAPKPVFSVSELNEYVSLTLSHDPNLSDIRVLGEISGFKRHSSGHLYFSLKDQNALVRCVMFRQNAYRLDFSPTDGMKVLLIGQAALYEKDGSFQLYARVLRKSGEGELFRLFMQQKAALEAQGLFDESHKKPIPFLPRRVGVVTSETGAAIQDIINVVQRRFSTMPIVLCSVPVQGEGAAKRIAAGVRRMNHAKAADVLIVGRGGGSMEDLWAFNETVVAEAIYESEIPVVSAVGHETDFTIADFVADLRAPTPSAAAELVTPELASIQAALMENRSRMARALQARLAKDRANVRLFRASGAFRLMEQRVTSARVALENERERAVRAAQARGLDARARLSYLQSKLDALSPNAVLLRGYAIVTKPDGATVCDAGALAVGEAIRLRMRDGAAQAEITDIIRDPR